MTENTSSSTKQVHNTKQLTKRGRFDVYDDDTPPGTIEIKEMLQSLTTKFDAMNITITGNDARLNTKIDNLETSLSSKISEVRNEMEVRIQTVSKDLNQRLEAAVTATKLMCEETASKPFIALSGRVEDVRVDHESRLDRLERLSLEKDLVISGVPMENNDDPIAIVGDICGALNCNLKQGDFVSAFRLKANGSYKNQRILPIVACIQDSWVKQELLTAYFRKKSLSLTDIGFRTPARIIINERVTSANRAIFNRAAEAKRSSLIHRFFTRRGLVVVQRTENSKPSYILQIVELDSLFSSSSSGKQITPNELNGPQSSEISLPATTGTEVPPRQQYAGSLPTEQSTNTSRRGVNAFGAQ